MPDNAKRKGNGSWRGWGGKNPGDRSMKMDGISLKDFMNNERQHSKNLLGRLRSVLS